MAAASTKAPANLETVLHYANAAPTEATWRRVALGPFAKMVLAPGQEPPETPTMGVKSCRELDEVLGAFRSDLDSWIHLESPYALEAESLLHAVVDKARLHVKGWSLSVRTEKIVPEWQTSETFPAMLYGTMLMAFSEVPYSAVHRCVECETFFYNPAKRDLMYCSKRCQNRAMAKRFRERMNDTGSGGAKKATTKTGAGRRKAK